jgi:uncharacterized protein (TIGR02118 family)
MEQFQEYALKTHVPLVEAIPGLRGYVQNFAVPNEATDAPPYDNVVELLFDSREAYEEGMTSPEAETAIADQENFLAESAVPMVVDENVLRRPKMRA